MSFYNNKKQIPKGSSYINRKLSSSQLDFPNKKDDLLTKEEEYKRMNEELEKKTAHLVFEAEQVLKANERFLFDTEYLDRIEQETSKKIAGYVEEPIKKPEPVLKQIQDYEDDDEYQFQSDINILPKAANEMSNEAQIRFLKAKLKVTQEELEKYGSDLSKKDEENFKLAQRCKELEEDRVKQLRISNSHQTQMEKYKKLSEDNQTKISQLETQLKMIKNENEQLKRDTKKSSQDTQQLELRLNRSLEEIEKLKLELSKQMTSKKDLNEQDRTKIENLNNENKKLQKQKLELIQAFKKQLKLIDLLKKQKLHLEASRLLQFTEQEFINALEWNPMSNPEPAPSVKSKTSSRPPSGLVNQKRSSLKNEQKKGSNRTNSMIDISELDTIENDNIYEELNGDLEHVNLGSDSEIS
ncbi:unnamed protein product [Brachionus calyciflorus]|uniref:Uncharacterized protein n=1 Tax=Brachionus calyciflorus TaxID=104777 RepID=A0A813TPJ0_9BILA|nr:unnamed protein product [Brachionus calyciflorus]